MRIRSYEIFRYELPLRETLNIAGHRIHVRRGLILALHDEEGFTGYGEIAPLAGLHSESLEDAQNQLKQVISSFYPFEFDQSVLQLKGNLSGHLEGIAVYPSVRFGLEQAVLLLYAAREHRHLFQLQNPAVSGKIIVNALITDPSQNAEEKLNAILQNGYRTVKVKVGRNSLSADAVAIRQIHMLSKGRLILRLDANRAWKLKEALEFANKIKDIPVEYIEDPLNDPANLGEFHHKTGIHTALDESLPDMFPSAIPDGTVAVILKPSVVGGFEKCAELVQKAVSQNIYPVFSCAFLSCIGFMGVCHLTAALGRSETPMGLETFRWFPQDLCKQEIPFQSGIIDLNILPPGTPAPDLRLLESIEMKKLKTY